MNKNQFMEWMRSNNMFILMVEFDGSGDQGWIDSMEASPLNGDSPVEINDSQAEVIDTFVHSVLDDNLSGWEIEDGSFGTVRIDSEDEDIEVQYNERLLTSQQFNYTF